MAGFREWPPGINRRQDPDSGPILEGIGSVATALGVGAANAMGDYITCIQLKNLEKFIVSSIAILRKIGLKILYPVAKLLKREKIYKNIKAKLNSINRINHDILAEAIRFNSKHVKLYDK